jgi:hypothetical protein
MKKNQLIKIYYSDSGCPELLGIINDEYCRRKRFEFFLVNTLFIFKHYEPGMHIFCCNAVVLFSSHDFQLAFSKDFY